MSYTFNLRTRTGLFRAAAVLCVFLISITGFVAAVHFHADGAGTTDRACSVCALAHSGVAPVDIRTQIPVLTPTVMWEPFAEASHSLLLTSSNFIRPPPTA